MLESVVVTMSGLLQELRVFLEADVALGQAQAWQSLQPMQNSLLDGVARLPKQLLGEHFSCHVHATARR